MDLVSTCKDKLAYFRIKELKDVLTKLGLSKQGKKQDLVDRILTILSDEQVSKVWQKKNAIGKEGVAKLVEDTYRKMQVSGAPDLASKCAEVSDTSSLKPKEEIDVSHQSVSKIRCVCGSSLAMDSTIQCDDPKCHVMQHFNCVIIADKPMERSLTPPEQFYCELCRLVRADPFLVAVAHPVPPVKLNIASIPTDGGHLPYCMGSSPGTGIHLFCGKACFHGFQFLTNPVQTVERTFQLTRADKDSLLKQDYDIQAWCMLLNDKVPFRMQWPQYADLQVNGIPVRVINRPGSQLLGANGRDDGAIITPCIIKDGINKICLTGCDARVFCLGVRLVKRRSLQQILSLIPKESDGEPFEDALTRVRRCVGGGPSADNADSDSDLEVVAEYIAVNLRCPMSGSRMKVAGRFKPCVHMGCFDLEIFVEMNQRSRKWQCPVCLKNYSVENIIIDPYFNRITSMMRHCGEDVTEVEVKPEGSWRIKSKSDSERRDLGDLWMWRLPDGSVCVPRDGDIKSEMVKEVKQEGTSDNPASLKLRKNQNGIWEVKKPYDMNTFSSSRRLEEVFMNCEPKVIPMTSSATGSGREGEDASVNQDGGGNFDISTTNGIEYDSIPLNVEPGFGFVDHNISLPTGDAEVIVLSDSDDDMPMISSAPMFKDNHIDTNGVNFSVSPGISNLYPDDSNLGSGVGLGFFSNDDEFGMPIWPLPPGNQVAQGLQLFGSDTDAPGAFGDLQHSTMNGSSSMNGYSLAPGADMGSTLLFPESAAGNAEVDINDGLVDNPMVFGGDDPSLHLFLPTRDSDASVCADFGDWRDTSNGGISTDDWISLRLGGGASGNQGPSRTVHGPDLRTQLPSGDGALESLADTAALLLGMNGGKFDNGSRQVSDSPFSFPRQKRSVRPRLFLSIDSDSE